MLRHRSTDPELMDDLDYKGEDLGVTLKELDFINRWLGGDRISMSAFRTMFRSHNIKTIADLGCGSGTFLKKVQEKFPGISCSGVDANPAIIDFAKRTYTGIEFICQNIQDPALIKRKFDVIHCCLFLHHFSNEKLADLFKSFKDQAKVGIIVNDLHRHYFAYYAIKFLTGIFSKSRLVKHDAKLSVRRGFKRKDLIGILDAAGITDYQLKWKWAFRWQLIIYTNP